MLSDPAHPSSGAVLLRRTDDGVGLQPESVALVGWSARLSISHLTSLKIINLSLITTDYRFQVSSQ